MRRSLRQIPFALAIVASCMGASWLLFVALATPVQAQMDPSGQYQVYPLQHKAAADVEKMLGEMLSSLGPTTQVIADVRNNQLMVRGPQQAHQIARQLIESIDRPTAANTAAAPVLKAYPCLAAYQADATNRLRAQWAGREDVRIAADAASAQLFILAPPAIQEAIAPQLAGMNPAAAPMPLNTAAPPPVPSLSAPSLSAAPRPLAFGAPPAAPPQANREQFAQLVNSRVEQLEPVLQRVLGERLQPLPNPSPSRPNYAFIDANGNRVELWIDRAHNGLGLRGPDNLVHQFVRLIENLDTPADAAGRAMRILPVRRTDPSKVEEAVRAYKTGGRPPPNPNSSGAVNYARGSIGLLGYLFQEEGTAAAKSAAPSGVQPIPSTPPDEDEARRLRGLSTDVDIEYLPDLDVIILHGRDKDVEEVSKIIEELERIAAQTQPAIAVYPLKYASGDAMIAIIAKVSDSLTARQGRVMVMPLSKPNALLLIGWGEAVQAMKELIEKLDQPVPPDTQFRVFPLHNAPSAQVRATLQDFVSNRMGLAGKLVLTADVRTNSLIAQGAPRDLAELAAVIENLDKGQTAAVAQTRIFKLKNAMAIDLAGTLQSAIATARTGSSATGSTTAAATAGTKSAALELITVDPRGQKIIKSGILADVQITPDPRLNTLLVSAPAESMDLIAELIQQLDSPVASAQIKVFRILNSDAASMVLMLRSLLTRPAGTGGGAQGGSPTVSLSQEESVLTPLRFSVDARTNSIIAVGSIVDLRIVEALLLRLDEFDVQHRKSTVYRLKNAPAMDVATAINNYVRSEQQVQQAATGMVSAAEQIESQVVVVPEQVSNALIISATPHYFQEINDLVEKLDEAPAQVMIQVLIAQVSLSNYNEFGIEVGLQDSVLFDRSLLGSLYSASTVATAAPATLTNSTGSTLTQTTGTVSTSTNNTSSTQTIAGATNTPGYSFNGAPLGNSGSPLSLLQAPLVGSQGVTSFGTGVTNSQLGFGGLVLQASSENVSALLRALQEEKTMRVLSRPQIMTLDNQPAYVQVGSRVPRIQGTSVSAATLVNSITLENVGLILGVTPRVSPEGTVVMEVDAENSAVGPVASGTPVSAVNGTTILSPAITVTMAQTTISVRDGQTAVLAGLLTKSVATDDRKVPILGDIPVINWFFHYRSNDDERTELLIVLTPHVVRTPEEIDRVKKIETARMHWCLKDVECMHGNIGVRDKTPAIYPDFNPRGNVPAEGAAPKPEEIPTPTPAAKTSKWPLFNLGRTPGNAVAANTDAAGTAAAGSPPQGSNSPGSPAAPAAAQAVQVGYQEPAGGELPGVVYPNAVPPPHVPQQEPSSIPSPDGNGSSPR